MKNVVSDLARWRVAPFSEEDGWVFKRALAGYLLLWSGIWLTGYRFLDDRGRALWGNLGWEDNGRPLTTLVMRLFTRDGQLMDVTPLPQLLAILLMALSLVVLRRQLKAPARWSWLLCALPLFATPLYLENMAFRFDALTMTLAVFTALLSVGALWSHRPLVGVLSAAVWLLVTMMLYQPALNVFLALCCLHGGLAARRAGLKRLGHDVWRALLVLMIGLLLYWPVAQHFLPDAGYSAQHAERFDLASLPRGVLHNLTLAWQRVFYWLPAYALWPAVAVLALAIVAALRAPEWRKGVASLLCLALSPLALFGLMLVLVDPIWQPRAFLGLGGLIVCWSMLAWHGLQGPLWQRLLSGGVGIYLIIVLVQAWMFGAVLSELQRHERRMLSDVAERVNEQYLTRGYDRLIIQGAWGWPPVVERSRQRDPLLNSLMPQALSEGNYWNEPTLDLHGLYESIVVTMPAEMPPGEALKVLHESRYYRLWWNGRALVLTLQE